MDLSFKSVAATYKNGDVAVFKLNSGDEIIGRVVEVTDTEVVLERPFRVDLGPSDANPMVPVIKFMPALLAVQKVERYNIQRSNVAASVFPLPQATERYYLEQSTGLDLKSKPNQILNG